MKELITAFMVITYTIVGVIGSIPQIVKTFKTKSVADISLTSWVMWVASSTSYLLYAIVVNPTFELIFTSVLDAAFNIIIFGQILYYRHKNRKHKS